MARLASLFHFRSHVGLGGRRREILDLKKKALDELNVTSTKSKELVFKLVQVVASAKAIIKALSTNLNEQS